MEKGGVFPFFKEIFKKIGGGVFTFFVSCYTLRNNVRYGGHDMKFFGKAKVLAFLTAAALVLAACGGDGGSDSSDLETPPSDEAKSISALTITGPASISFNGNAVLTATATTTGSPTLKYTWTITSGGDYAYFNAAGTTNSTTTTNTVTLKANNTTTSAQTVKVTVTAEDTSDAMVTKTSSAYSITVAKKGETVTNAVTGVTLSVDKTSIAASGATATFTATPATTGNPTITYTWAITAVDEKSATSSVYATLSGSGTTATLTSKNTTTSSHTVTVKVTASYGTNPKTAIKTVTIEAASEENDDPAETNGATLSLTFLNGDNDLTVTAASSSSGYTFTAIPPSTTASYTYAWYVISAAGKATKQTSTEKTCTVASSADIAKIFVTATESGNDALVYSAEYGL